MIFPLLSKNNAKKRSVHCISSSLLQLQQNQASNADLGPQSLQKLGPCLWLKLGNFMKNLDFSLSTTPDLFLTYPDKNFPNSDKKKTPQTVCNLHSKDEPKWKHAEASLSRAQKGMKPTIFLEKWKCKSILSPNSTTSMFHLFCMFMLEKSKCTIFSLPKKAPMFLACLRNMQSYAFHSFRFQGTKTQENNCIFFSRNKMQNTYFHNFLQNTKTKKTVFYFMHFFEQEIKPQNLFLHVSFFEKNCKRCVCIFMFLRKIRMDNGRNIFAFFEKEKSCKNIILQFFAKNKAGKNIFAFFIFFQKNKMEN